MVFLWSSKTTVDEIVEHAFSKDRLDTKQMLMNELENNANDFVQYLARKLGVEEEKLDKAYDIDLQDWEKLLYTKDEGKPLSCKIFAQNPYDRYAVVKYNVGINEEKFRSLVGLNDKMNTLGKSDVHTDKPKGEIKE